MLTSAGLEMIGAIVFLMSLCPYHTQTNRQTNVYFFFQPHMRLTLIRSWEVNILVMNLKNALERSPNSKLTHVPPSKTTIGWYKGPAGAEETNFSFFFFQPRTCNMETVSI